MVIDSIWLVVLTILNQVNPIYNQKEVALNLELKNMYIETNL